MPRDVVAPWHLVMPPTHRGCRDHGGLALVHADKWARRVLLLEFTSYLLWVLAFQVSDSCKTVALQNTVQRASGWLNQIASIQIAPKYDAGACCMHRRCSSLRSRTRT
jgi:hypothetical protein